jgi:hypothetical protein
LKNVRRQGSHFRKPPCHCFGITGQVCPATSTLTRWTIPHTRHGVRWAVNLITICSKAKHGGLNLLVPIWITYGELQPEILGWPLVARP